MNLGYAHNVGTSGSILKMNGLTQNPANYVRSKAMTKASGLISLKQIMGTKHWLLYVLSIGLFAVSMLCIIGLALTLL